MHLHTNQSQDAFSLGNRSLTPEKAYRFARGETVISQSGLAARLSRPLDFLLVSDHAEFMGVFPKVFSKSPDIIETPIGKRWADYVESGESITMMMEFVVLSLGLLEFGNLGPAQAIDPNATIESFEELRGLKVPAAFKQSTWNHVGQVADEFNTPGLFTAFIGYEWTSTPGGSNLHRNVLFRDGSDMTSKTVPFSSMDSRDPEDLWQYLAEYEDQTGGRVLSIPHNGNSSNGLMFADTKFDGNAMTRNYAERRARWEPIYEVTQIKGDGETHPLLSPNDEFADFETWDVVLHANTQRTVSGLRGEYARSALKTGLALEQTLGVNPFNFGMVGGTDSHTGLSTADENNFFGKFSSSEPALNRSHNKLMPGSSVNIYEWHTAAAGYTAIWARENTRESLFDALERKETYATTGSRMTVRFFGGWNFDEYAHQRPDFADHGYQQGVPMGGRLTLQNQSNAPSFMVAALKDPAGANLDRIQIIKGWLDETGKAHEHVYNIAASDDRKIRRNKLNPVGETVDIDNASYLNSIGEASLSVVWRDPDFNPHQSAFYYVRVLEIPTPRWTTIDARLLGGVRPENAPAFLQERAYTSPIWYLPPND